MAQQIMNKEQVLNNLRTRWEMHEYSCHPDDSMPFDEWLDKMEGLTFYGWQLVRNSFTDRIKLKKKIKF